MFCSASHFISMLENCISAIKVKFSSPSYILDSHLLSNTEGSVVRIGDSISAVWVNGCFLLLSVTYKNPDTMKANYQML